MRESKIKTLTTNIRELKMNPAKRSRIAATISAIGLMTLNPSIAAASDFGPMVTYFFLFIAVVCGLSLILGAITWAILTRASRSYWGLVPFFSICWFFTILLGWEVWGTHQSESRPREPPQIIPLDYRYPEGHVHEDIQPVDENSQ